jgi:ribosomal protein L11 methyltransferase
VRITVLTVPATDGEIASDRLWLAGTRGVEERLVSRGVVELRACLSEDDVVSTAAVGSVPSSWSITFEDAEPVPRNTWRDFAAGVTISSTLTLQPAWQSDEHPDNGIVVLIEPGGAFGLGDHPTTRLSAASVESLVRSGDRVLDVGCGTGVLAIVAAMLGARRAVAIDNSAAACEATVDNALRNGVSERVDASTTPPSRIEGRFDLVIANILAPTLIAMASDLRRLTAPGGHLVISGVLDGKHDHVLDALAPMTAVETHVLDGWASVALRHTD